MRGLTISAGTWLIAAVAALSIVTPAAIADDEPPQWIRTLVDGRKGPALETYRARQKYRLEQERELKKLRSHYFRTPRPDAVRAEGIEKLRAFNDPALYPSLIEIFSTEGLDVRLSILDLFREQSTHEADASLAWVAVHDRDAVIRTASSDRLSDRSREIMSRTADSPPPTRLQSPSTDGVKLVIYQALTRGNDSEKVAAARLANTLGIVEAVPWLIATQAQLAPQTTGTQVGGDRNGALAWILVGTQTAFVSDLTPVVGPNAVAFDPELSIITEGTILRVFDAAVVTYHVDLNTQLIDLTSRAWGRPTRQLGWDLPAWRQWYERDFLPFLKAPRPELAGVK